MASSVECSGGRFGDGLEQRRFSNGEVAVFSGADNAWIVVDGEVCDVTEILQSHLGDSEVSKKLYPILFLQ